jgi:hypothetical protein
MTLPCFCSILVGNNGLLPCHILVLMTRKSPPQRDLKIFPFTAMKKDATTILIFVLIAYSLLVVSTHFTQSYVIFRSGGASTKPPKPLDVTEVLLVTPDGKRLNAWWQQTKDAKKMKYLHL